MLRKRMMKRGSVCLVLVMAFLVLMPAMPARAVVPYQNINYKKNINLYYSKDPDYNYYSMDIKGKIKSARFSRASVAKFIEKDGGDHIGFQIKKPGKTVLTVKTSKKTYKVKLNIRKFKTAFKKFQIGKKKVKGINPQARFGEFSGVCRVAEKKQHLSIKLKSGWKLKAVKTIYRDEKGKETVKKIKNNSNFDLSPMFSPRSDEYEDFREFILSVKVYNKKKKETRTVKINLFTPDQE